MLLGVVALPTSDCLSVLDGKVSYVCCSTLNRPLAINRKVHSQPFKHPVPLLDAVSLWGSWRLSSTCPFGAFTNLPGATSPGGRCSPGFFMSGGHYANTLFLLWNPNPNVLG